MRPKAVWAIDSEAMRARGIIVLVKSEQQITYSEKYIIICILRGDLLSFNQGVIFWRFFIIFNILKSVFKTMRNLKE